MLEADDDVYLVFEVPEIALPLENFSRAKDFSRFNTNGDNFDRCGALQSGRINRVS